MALKGWASTQIGYRGHIETLSQPDQVRYMTIGFECLHHAADTFRISLIFLNNPMNRCHSGRPSLLESRTVGVVSPFHSSSPCGELERNGLVSSFIADSGLSVTSHDRVSPMSRVTIIVFVINLLILGVPTVMLAVAWNRLAGDWRNGIVQSTAGTASLFFASSSMVVALGSLLWQVFVRPIARHDYRTEVSGLLLSVAALISGFLTRDDHENQYWPLGLAAAGWMFLWFVATAFSH
jgi:hypothetical protein